MNIYLVQQDIVTGYDTYDSFVCVAESEQEAREMHPSDFEGLPNQDSWKEDFIFGSLWVEFKDIDKVKVTSIGVAHSWQQKGIIIASFNAG